MPDREPNESMVFTELVQRLNLGDEVDEGLLDQVWVGLRRALAAQLRRRKLWSLPPRYLGIEGYARWAESRESIGIGSNRDALEELTAIAYEQVFVDRIGAIADHLQSKPNVEGLVHLCLRNLIHDRQRRNDPIGYRMFDLLKRTIALALERGLVEPWNRNPASAVDGEQAERTARVDAEARFLFASESQAPDVLFATAEHCGALPFAELMPELVTALGKRQHGLLERLLGCLELLQRRLLEKASASQRVGFRFGDLLPSLKATARGSWAAALEEDLGEFAAAASASRENDSEQTQELVRIVTDRHLFAEQQSFERLARTVERDLLHSEGERAEQELALWRTLVLAARHDSEVLDLSQRKLSTLLGVSRSNLRRSLEAVRAAVRAALADPGFQRIVDTPCVDSPEATSSALAEDQSRITRDSTP